MFKFFVKATDNFTYSTVTDTESDNIKKRKPTCWTNISDGWITKQRTTIPSTTERYRVTGLMHCSILVIHGGIDGYSRCVKGKPRQWSHNSLNCLEKQLGENYGEYASG